jgi:hypothetical protein
MISLHGLRRRPNKLPPFYFSPDEPHFRLFWFSFTYGIALSVGDLVFNTCRRPAYLHPFKPLLFTFLSSAYPHSPLTCNPHYF